MRYYEKRVEILKRSSVLDYEYPIEEADLALKGLCTKVRSLIKVEGEETTHAFIYYEKMAGANRILGFRMPGTDSYLIYQSEISRVRRNVEPRTFVAGLNGVEAIRLYEATSGFIREFFAVMEEAYGEYLSSIHLVDVVTGKSFGRALPIGYKDMECTTSDLDEDDKRQSF